MCGASGCALRNEVDGSGYNCKSYKSIPLAGCMQSCNSKNEHIHDVLKMKFGGLRHRESWPGAFAARRPAIDIYW